MQTQTVTFVYSSDLFLDLGFDDVADEFFSSDLSFTFGDTNISLISLGELLDELQNQPLELEERVDEFIAKVKALPDYDPELYIDLEN